MTQMYRDPKTFEIIGAAMEVHRELGSGFLEAVYQEALAIEFGARKIPFQKEIDLPICYKEVVLSTSYRADFICHGDNRGIESNYSDERQGRITGYKLSESNETKDRSSLELWFRSTRI